MIEGIKGVDFYPKKGHIICKKRHHADHVLMTTAHRKGEEKWFIQLDVGLLGDHPATIYFNTEDAKTFRDKINESLEGLNGSASVSK
ncbi:MAG: hypothetical protein WAM14_19430 [Candidatus Nitrosopolaris sp.]